MFDKVEVLNLMKGMLGEGESLSNMAKKLNALGYTTSQERKWSPASVHYYVRTNKIKPTDSPRKTVTQTEERRAPEVAERHYELKDYALAVMDIMNNESVGCVTKAALVDMFYHAE